MDKDTIDELQDDWNRQRPDLDSDPMGAVLRVQALSRYFTDQAALRLQEFDLAWWQYDVLSTLRRQGEPFMLAATELADATRLTSGAMTNRIDRLEQAGLVSRKRDQNDRRRVWIQLSSKGLGVVEGATVARFQAAAASLRGLNQSQQKHLSDLLRLALLAMEN